MRLDEALYLVSQEFIPTTPIVFQKVKDREKSELSIIISTGRHQWVGEEKDIIQDLVIVVFMNNLVFGSISVFIYE